MSFRFRSLQIPDVILIEPRNRVDERGFFRETFKASVFAINGISSSFVQDNYSHSLRGVVRGLHYQNPPGAQAKLVAVCSGEIFDVAVDIRRGSPTFGRWVGETLSAQEGCLMYIPPGFAHGFCVRSEQADVLYKVTTEYSPELDRGIVWNDPAIGIRWPVVDAILSGKDAQLPRLADADNRFSV